MRLLARKSKFIVLGIFLFLLTYGFITYFVFDQHKLRPLNIINNQDRFEVHRYEQPKAAENIVKPKPNKEVNDNSHHTEKSTNVALVLMNKKKHFKAYDGGGFGAVNTGIAKCANELTVEVVGSRSFAKSDISYFHMSVPSKETLEFKNKRHYSMVYTMESEPHSHGGDTWSNADFRMWYNLDGSFPEPATYFDVRIHLIDLLAPPRVQFEQKESEANIVWIVSNCNAYNGREKFMKQLMNNIAVHSYGGCLKNKNSHPSEHMKGNINLFAKYKFVIAIENSNCQDYVTEKLVHAVASGSIPIVAGKNDKPDYLKFMPAGSYLNVYDFESPSELAARIKSLASNKQEYNKYMSFKFAHNYTREYLTSLDLGELIRVAKTFWIRVSVSSVNSYSKRKARTNYAN